MGIAPNDALSWRGSIGTEIRPNNEGKKLCLKRGYDRQGGTNYAHSNVFFVSTKRFSGSLVFLSQSVDETSGCEDVCFSNKILSIVSFFLLFWATCTSIEVGLRQGQPDTEIQ
jgi:hypothetical protein